METVVYVRGNRANVRRTIAKAVKAASGGSSADVASAMQVRLGMTALGLIKDAFVTKSKGGTDECGLKWPPLKRETIAYSRRHPGVPPAKERAGFSPSWMLTDKQRAKWWELYRRGLARFKGDKSRAAKLAWAILKGMGAKTLIGEYGDTPVLILRDLGLLLNSLSPGVESSDRMPANPPKVENQVFVVTGGSVIVGTNRKGAAAHHKGIPGRLPQRRLWAEPNQWPGEWWGDIADQGRMGYIDILLYFLRNP